MANFKKFILTLLLFILSLYVINQLYKPVPTPFDEKFIEFSTLADSVEVLEVGNSHLGALSDFPIGNLKVYNMSYAAMELENQYIILSKILNQKNKIKTVLLSFDYDQIGHVTSNSIIENMLLPTKKDLSKGVDWLILTLKPIHFLKHNRDLPPLIQYYFKNKNVQKENVIVTVDFKDKSDIKKCRQRALQLGKLAYNKKRIDDNIKYIKLISSLAKQHNIKCLFISTPKGKCFSEYYDQYVSDTQKTQAIKVMKDNNCIFLDYYKDTRFTEDDILDFDHLNANGAQKLNSILSEYIKNN